VPLSVKLSTAGFIARRLFVLLAAALAVTLVAAAPESSEPSPLAHRALLLDITRVGDRLVAVGDRGHIIISADEGATWSQCITPTRAMLTGVSFADEMNGWAVGHDGVILRTADGGKTWARQDKGTDTDTVFLDVLFLDAQRGFAIGAYGKFLVTLDGGQTWSERRVYDEDLHLNRISQDLDGQLFLAGERGLILISSDQGVTWRRSPLAYEGSLFGIRPLTGGVLIAYGLRGHVFVSTDNGESWQPRETDAKVLLMACARLRDGVAVIAGQGGNFYISRDSGRTFNHWKSEDFGSSIADLAVLKDGSLLTVGEAGAVRIAIP
jgi:photosystem II stability/assembly factor-like uncharacterized protein